MISQEIINQTLHNRKTILLDTEECSKKIKKLFFKISKLEDKKRRNEKKIRKLEITIENIERKNQVNINKDTGEISQSKVYNQRRKPLYESIKTAPIFNEENGAVIIVNKEDLKNV